MNISQAATKADSILDSLLKSHPNLVDPSNFYSIQDGERFARTIAAFRGTLISQLVEQEE